MAAELDLSQPERRLRDLARAMRQEEGGREMRRALTKRLRAAAGPVRQAVRAAIRAAPSAGHSSGRSLRSAIAQKVQTVAKTGGKAVGVRIVAKETTSVRGFTHAPRRFNSAAGWHHQTFGGEPEVHQTGEPGWFDDTIWYRKAEFRGAVEEVIEETAQRVARGL
ncbi:hypothetical protein NQK81_13285 [Amycolatopsis roodepoortensis]|uniref:hypothetical protein n=1 Tax=Amycolatopsis roodepoortensis TaxID=700274 RepID=UPI00214BEB4D|nr:hypothetical protein [Amycolatopsis roodepoortensis]UUV34378.1 hypothetical protein NQK81_13285 [Amycolatopsis roodepoortensis]